MIRFALDADVPAIQLITKLSLTEAYVDLLSAEVQEEFLKTNYSQDVIKERIGTMNVLMCDTEAGTVGFALFAVEDDLMRIFALYVLPAHQRQGAGQSLLDGVVAIAKETTSGVGIEVESRNLASQKFYSQAGFEVEKTYPFDLFGQPLKMTYLVKRF